MFLGSISVFNFGGGPTDLIVTRKSRPSNPAYPSGLFTLCDAPAYTIVPMQTVGSFNGEPVAFQATMNRCPPLGVYGDAGTATRLCAPRNVSTVLHLVGTTGASTSDGVTGAEFRIEVSNPTGYQFSYAAPADATTLGNVFDLNPADSTNAAGVTVLFSSSSCQPPSPPRHAGDRVDFGTVTIVNVAGDSTELRVKRKVPPDNPSMPCPRFFKCDSPFFTPVCMTSADVVSRTMLNGAGCYPPAPSAPLSLTAILQGTSPETVLLQWQPPATGSSEGYNIYRSVSGGPIQKINAGLVGGTSYTNSQLPSGSLCYTVTAVDFLAREGPPSASACTTPFANEALLLDTHEASNDGAAGPVSTSQVLDDRHSFLITVQGTFSRWPPSTWTAPSTVLCGRPEQAPQTVSPGTTNGWVGADPEILFSVPLPPGGDCGQLAALGYPRHPASFEVDLGTGFVHIEPLGGTPTDPYPDHRYRYLVRGHGSVARFEWLEATTSDNYGVLTITIEQVNLTDASGVPARTRVTMLPNVPDPFNPSTEIRYVLPGTGAQSATVGVYDIRGRLLRELFRGIQSGGYQAVRWDGRLDSGTPAASGVYFARVVTPKGTGTERLTLLK